MSSDGLAGGVVDRFEGVSGEVVLDALVPNVVRLDKNKQLDLPDISTYSSDYTGTQQFIQHLASSK